MKKDDTIKLIIVGESCVGKTSIVNKYVSNNFTNHHTATIGLEYFTKEEKIDDKILHVKIFDTAGQEKFKSLTRNFYKNSDGVIICYDVTKRKSFENIEMWVDSIKYNSSPNIKMILVGNKIDLEKEVYTEEGIKLAEDYRIPYYETSAKTCIGINECFIELITDIVTDVNFNQLKKEIKLDKKIENKSAECKC